MTTIKYKKIKVNYGGEVWHVLNIYMCVFDYKYIMYLLFI
jgi:hypothetical protein